MDGMSGAMSGLAACSAALSASVRERKELRYATREGRSCSEAVGMDCMVAMFLV